MALAVLSLLLLGVLCGGLLASRALKLPPRLFVVMALGLSLNHALVLAGIPLKTFSLIHAGAGLAGFIVGRRDLKALFTPLKSLGAGWTGKILMLLLAIVVLNTLGVPLMGVDARKIWFFHARVMVDSGRFNPADFANPFIAFTHTDYPKLVPVLAAQLAAFAGFWNEYIPKGSLIVMIFTVLAGFSALSLAAVKRNGLLCLLLLLAGSRIWDGYMDSWLALLGVLACLHLKEWLDSRQSPSLVQAILAAGLATQLKNEGLALWASVIFVGLVIARIERHWRTVWAPAALSLLPWVIWTLEKKTAGIASEFLDSPVPRLLARASDLQVWSLIFREIAFQRLVILSAVAALAVAFARRHSREWLQKPVPALIALVYTGALVLAWLVTPYDLPWHIALSANRVTMAVAFMLLAWPFSSSREDRAP